VAGKALPKTGQGPADEQPSWAWLAALGTGAILAVALFTLRRLGGRRRVAPVATVAIGRLADQSVPRRGA
jgi:hypothetical protein